MAFSPSSESQISQLTPPTGFDNTNVGFKNVVGDAMTNQSLSSSSNSPSGESSLGQYLNIPALPTGDTAASYMQSSGTDASTANPLQTTVADSAPTSTTPSDTQTGSGQAPQDAASIIADVLKEFQAVDQVIDQQDQNDPNASSGIGSSAPATA